MTPHDEIEAALARLETTDAVLIKRTSSNWHFSGDSFEEPLAALIRRVADLATDDVGNNALHVQTGREAGGL